MIRLLLAAALLLSVTAPSRAEQDDAYGSLVGMADSAAADKGPDAGELPKDEIAQAVGAAPRRETPPDAAAEPASAEKSATPAPERPARARREKPAPAREETQGAESPAVSVPVAPAPRVWTRLFSSLLPPAARLEAFDVAGSTSAPRARPASPRSSTPASAAGSAQGLLELVATATAPAAPEAPER